jgi:hypothetical protein
MLVAVEVGVLCPDPQVLVGLAVVEQVELRHQFPQEAAEPLIQVVVVVVLEMEPVLQKRVVQAVQA